MGLGFAKTGVAHWWLQRVTAVALVPLLMWFIASLIAHAGGDHGAMVAWLGKPVVAILMVLLLITLFQHMALGLRVVIEDYVHTDRWRFAAVAAVQIGCLVLTVAGVLATLAIAVGG